jgi:hypothetical protein
MEDMDDNRVPNGLSRGCRVFCSRRRTRIFGVLGSREANAKVADRVLPVRVRRQKIRKVSIRHCDLARSLSRLCFARLLTQPWLLPRFSKFLDLQRNVDRFVTQFNIFDQQHV